jgi:hypothetical protein
MTNRRHVPMPARENETYHSAQSARACFLGGGIPQGSANTEPAAPVRQIERGVAEARRDVAAGLPFLMHLAAAPVINQHCGIYQISLIGTDRCYVGSSRSMGGRLRTHAKALVAGVHSNVKLQSAWREYGADRFRYRILERIENEHELVEAEQRWIDHFRAADIGFNILPTVGRKKIEASMPPMPTAQPVASRAPTTEPFAIYFLFLVATAGAMYYFKWPILLIAAIVGLCQVLLFLCHRYPRTMWFMLGFLRALLGGRG